MTDTAAQLKNSSETDGKLKTTTSPRINSKTKRTQKKCKCKCEIYARVTGYMSPVKNWNRGKKEEYQGRVTYKVA